MKGQWALVTGASAGIGRACALKLAAQGCHLVIVARRQDKLDDLAREIRSRWAVEVMPFRVDLSDIKDIEKFAQEKVLSNISILINSAGLAREAEPMHKAKWENWEVMIQTNVLGLLRLTHAMLSKLIEKPQAHIVNLGSISGRWVYPGGGVYCATKFAVRALSEGLRMDLVGKPVRVTNIEPGMVETEFSRVRFGDAEKAKKVYEGMTPLVADDIAEAIVWCLARPPHVNVQEMVIFPTDQAATGLVHRKMNRKKGDESGVSR